MLSLPIVKFKSQKNNPYVFDVNTNHILNVSQVAYDIIEDVGYLEDIEIISNYTKFYKKEDIVDAISEIKKMQTMNILKSIDEHIVPHIRGLQLYGKTYALSDFLKNYSRMITIELTNKCNLNCDYCCYGIHYSRFRSHGTTTIKKSVAERAIQHHLEIPHSGNTITFYGGEPLLEFELIKHLVEYAERICVQNEQEKPRFGLTTNGTLLDDETIGYLVDHDFTVIISIDGDQECHDRYRTFKGNKKKTFDLVTKNIQRFIELYPDYSNRGLSLTITADNNLQKTNEFLKKHIIHFPVILANFVKDDLDFFIGHETCESSMLSCTQFVQKQATINNVPDFAHWNAERYMDLKRGQDNFISCFANDPIAAKSEWPLFFEWFASRFRKIHKRKIKKPNSAKIACGCIPGAVRLYCNIDGNYYPCEKVETTEVLKIGDVWTGVDPDKVTRLFDYITNKTNCNSCIGKSVCNICPAHIIEGENGFASSYIIKKECENAIADIQHLLSEYATIMEKNSVAFDLAINESTNDDWLMHVLFVIEKQRGCTCPDSLT